MHLQIWYQPYQYGEQAIYRGTYASQNNEEYALIEVGCHLEEEFALAQKLTDLVMMFLTSSCFSGFLEKLPIDWTDSRHVLLRIILKGCQSLLLLLKRLHQLYH